MTQSYNIGGVTPVDIDPYEPTEYDPVENINKKIDEDIRDWERYFTERANYYQDALSPDKSAGARLARFAKGVAEDAPIAWKPVERFNEYNSFYRHAEAADKNLHYIDENGDIKGIDGAYVDSDVNEDQKLESQQNLDRSNANKLDARIGGQITGDLREKLLTLSGSVTNRNSRITNLNLAAEKIPLMLDVWTSGMKIIIPAEISETGDQKVVTGAETFSADEIEFVYGILAAAGMEEAELIANNLGISKRYYGMQLKTALDNWRLERYEEVGEAVKSQNIKDRQKEVLSKIKDNPGFFVDYVGIHGTNGGNAAAKQWITETMISGIESGDIDASIVEAVKAHKFKAYSGEEVTVGDYWSAQTDRIDKALRKAQKEEYQAYEIEQENIKNSAMAHVREEFRKNRSEENLIRLEGVYRKMTGQSELHEDFKTLLTYRDEDDLAIVQRVKERAAMGHMITDADIDGINDPTLQKELQKLVGTGLSADNKSKMEEIIKTLVNEHRGENDANRTKTNKWVANKLGSTNAYISAFNEAKANGGSDAEAHKAGIDAVKDGLEKHLWDRYEDVLPDFNVNLAARVRQVGQKISKDNSLLDSNAALEGEQEAIVEVSKYFANKPGGKMPEYYRLLSIHTKMSPGQLARHRLNALGIMKKSGDFIFPEEKNLNKADQEKLFYRPSNSRTYQVTQENEDLTWLVDTIAAPSAIANGGYEAIRNPDGEYVQLQKPLTELTIWEVSALADRGYTNIGMFGISGYELRRVIASVPNLNLDDKFDVDTQDKLVLAVLRYKANNKNNNRGVDQTYRRLVYVQKEDRDEFLNLVGNLPPWLQLENLIPDAAKALVDDTLSGD